MATKQASKTATKGGSAKTASNSSSKRAASEKAPAKKAAAKKSAAKTAPAKKAAARKPSTARGAKKSSARKYSPAASGQVGRELHEMHQGTLKSGSTGRKITNPKQAIAIGLSEARRAGKKVPPNPNNPKKK